MDPHIEWPHSQGRHTLSPFSSAEDPRPLRITFHDSSFASAPPDEVNALALLHKLSSLPDVDALETEPGDLPRLELKFSEATQQTIPINITAPGCIRYQQYNFPNLGAKKPRIL